MRYIVYSKIGGAILVLLGFACWLGASALIPRSSDWFFPVTYSVAGLAFFLVGCFLPESRDQRFILSRKSVLQLMAFFFWLAGSAAAQMSVTQAMREEAAWITPVLVFGLIAIGLSSYFMAMYLIRGFRAPLEYLAEFNETLQAEQVGAGSRRFDSV